MPTYEYECKNCGKHHEAFQSITAKPLSNCPHCKKKNALKRLIGSGGGVIFKGSGFYQTDYRSSSYQKAAEKEKPKTASCPASGSCQKASKSCPAKES
jgi:putative FmdB family regulatory protein